MYEQMQQTLHPFAANTRECFCLDRLGSIFRYFFKKTCSGKTLWFHSYYRNRFSFKAGFIGRDCAGVGLTTVSRPTRYWYLNFCVNRLYFTTQIKENEFQNETKINLDLILKAEDYCYMHLFRNMFYAVKENRGWCLKGCWHLGPSFAPLMYSWLHIYPCTFIYIYSSTFIYTYSCTFIYF